MVARVTRLLIATLMVLTLLLGVTPATAEAPAIRIVVNGQQVAMDVDPVIIDGRVMVPARFVAEALGATVSWDPDGRRVVIQSAATGTASTAGDWQLLRAVAEPNKCIGVPRTTGVGTYLKLVCRGHWAEYPTSGTGDVAGTSDAGIPMRGRIIEGYLYVYVPDLRAAGLVP